MPDLCSRSCYRGRRPPLCKLRLAWPSKDRQASTVEPSLSITQNAFFRDYRIFWRILKILGIFPYHIDRQGDLKFHIVSKEMVYALLVYGLASVPVLFVLCIRYHQRSYFAGNFDSEICLYLLSLLLVPHLFIPFSHWMFMRRAVAIFQKWRNFEKSYEATMNEKMQLDLRWSSHMYLVICALLFTCTVLFEYVINAADYTWEIVAHIYVLFFILIHLIITLSIGYRLIQLARNIRLKLIQAIHSNDVELVSQIASLWAKFSETCNLLGCLFHRMFGYILVMAFTVSTITWYSLLKAFSNNDLRIGLLYQVACLMNNSLWIFSLCECGQRITAEGSRKFIQLIAAARPYVKKVEMKSELDGFVGLITSLPVALTINGYVNVDRRLMVSIKGTMVTYLIVVLQFSQDYVAHNDRNSTMVDGNSSVLFEVNRKCLFSA